MASSSPQLVHKVYTESKQFNALREIVFNPFNEKLYVADCSNNRVQVLNSDLTFFSKFGEIGSGKGQFNFPNGIACDSAGKVYVAEFYNHRIQVFTAERQFLRAFGKHEQGKGELTVSLLTLMMWCMSATELVIIVCLFSPLRVIS